MLDSDDVGIVLAAADESPTKQVQQHADREVPQHNEQRSPKISLHERERVRRERGERGQATAESGRQEFGE